MDEWIASHSRVGKNIQWIEEPYLCGWGTCKWGKHVAGECSNKLGMVLDSACMSKNWIEACGDR